MSNFKDDELWQAMEAEVNAYVHRYHDDFYVHDKNALQNYAGRFFVWSVGDYGTHFAKLPDSIGMIAGILKSYGHYCHFFCDRVAGTLRAMTLNELEQRAYIDYPDYRTK